MFDSEQQRSASQRVGVKHWFAWGVVKGYASGFCCGFGTGSASRPKGLPPWALAPRTPHGGVTMKVEEVEYVLLGFETGEKRKK